VGGARGFSSEGKNSTCLFFFLVTHTIFGRASCILMKEVPFRFSFRLFRLWLSLQGVAEYP
jgi:hypothetical protein